MTSGGRAAEPRLDVVIPVYEEERILERLHARLLKTLRSMDLRWRIIYVDDGSRDGSPEVLAGFCDADDRVALVELSRNFGQQHAIAAGLVVSQADAVVLMDGDLQDPPELIPRLVREWEAGHDVVYAVKKERKEAWPKRFLFALFYRVLRSLSPVEMPPDAGNFSLMDGAVVDLINRMPERNRYVSGLRAYAGGRQTGVEYEREERRAGRPRMSLRKLARLAGDAIFGFSDIPLRLATWLGFAVSLVAFGVLGNVLYKRLVTGEAIPGWASTMTSILFLGGVQLIALGVLGEYVARIHAETRGRLPYVVESYRNLPRSVEDRLPRPLRSQPTEREHAP